MNKKTAIATIILGIFLIGIASSGVISHFGKIKSTINILPPEIGVDVPAEEEDCRNNGDWENLMTLGVRFFDNEIDCINYVQTNMCEDFKLLEGYPKDFDNYENCVSSFGNEDTNSTGTNDTTTGDTNSTGTGEEEIINGEGDEEEE